MYSIYDFDTDVQLVGAKVGIFDIGFSDELVTVLGEISDHWEAYSCIISQEYTEKGYKYNAQIRVYINDTAAEDKSDYMRIYGERVKSDKERFALFCKDRCIDEYDWVDFKQKKVPISIAHDAFKTAFEKQGYYGIVKQQKPFSLEEKVHDEHEIIALVFEFNCIHKG